MDRTAWIGLGFGLVIAAALLAGDLSAAARQGADSACRSVSITR